LSRARKRSGVSLKEAAARISRITRVSYSTLMRLEDLRVEPDRTTPKGQERRVLAYLALLVYGIDPHSFGLSERDLPRWMTKEALGLLRPKSACLTGADAAA
jgi:hypothetical protein